MTDWSVWCSCYRIQIINQMLVRNFKLVHVQLCNLILPYYCFKDILFSFYITWTKHGQLFFTRSFEEESCVLISNLLLLEFFEFRFVQCLSVLIHPFDDVMLCDLLLNVQILMDKCQTSSNKDSFLPETVKWNEFFIRFCSRFLTKYIINNMHMHFNLLQFDFHL